MDEEVNQPTMEINCVLNLAFGTDLAEPRKSTETMPKNYEQDGKGDDAIVSLHYFAGGSANWWITEKDMETPEEPGQHQAFGLANMFGGPTDQDAELGYISIVELLAAGAELDFYFKPRTLRELKAPLHTVPVGEAPDIDAHVDSEEDRALARITSASGSSHPEMPYEKGGCSVRSRLPSVDLIASGYEWICPKCNHFNTEIEASESVTCKNAECHEQFTTNPPEHAYGWGDLCGRVRKDDGMIG
jgi:hypothetical protein